MPAGVNDDGVTGRLALARRAERPNLVSLQWN
jgi:hypothetical protein